MRIKVRIATFFRKFLKKGAGNLIDILEFATFSTKINKKVAFSKGIAKTTLKTATFWAKNLKKVALFLWETHFYEKIRTIWSKINNFLRWFREMKLFGLK